MERAIIFFGKENRNENYQLLIGINYFSAVYDGSIERKLFYESLSERFAAEFIKSPEWKNLVGRNGKRINVKTGKIEEVGKLEESLVKAFNDEVTLKVRAGLIKKSKENPGERYICISYGKE